MNGREVIALPRVTAMTGGRVAVAVAVTLVLAACSGDDDASPSTTLAPAPTSTEAPPTTVAATTPETTEPTPATTPVPVTTPPTLPPEPTTTATSSPPDEGQVKQDVIDAATATWIALNDLLLDPTNDDKLVPIADTRRGEALDRAIELLTSYRVRNLAERTNPEFPATVEFGEDPVVLDLVAGTAVVEYCRLGSNVWVEVAANADGSDRIVDDTINAYLEQDTFALVDGVWLKVSGVSLAKFEGELTCSPAA